MHGAAAPPPPHWYGVEGEAFFSGVPQRRLSLRASWSAPVDADVARIELMTEHGHLIWRTVLGWSPDRRTVPAPAVWVAQRAGVPRRVLLEQQPRDPGAEYTAQLDAAFAALADADPRSWQAALRTAQAGTAVLDAMQAALTTGLLHDFDPARPPTPTTTTEGPR